MSTRSRRIGVFHFAVGQHAAVVFIWFAQALVDDASDKRHPELAADPRFFPLPACGLRDLVRIFRVLVFGSRGDEHWPRRDRGDELFDPPAAAGIP